MADNYREKLYVAACKLEQALSDIAGFAGSVKLFTEIETIKLPLCEVIHHQVEAFVLLDNMRTDLAKTIDVIAPMQMWMLQIQEASTVAASQEQEPKKVKAKKNTGE